MSIFVTIFLAIVAFFFASWVAICITHELIGLVEHIARRPK